MPDEAIKALAVQVALDDGSFRDGVNSLKKQLSGIDSGFKASVAGLKSWGTNLDALKGNATALGEKVNVQKQIVEKYDSELKKLQTTLGENSQKMQDNKAKLDAAKKAYEESATSIGKNAEETKKLKAELDKAEKAYSSSETVVRKNNSAVQNYTVQLNEAKGKLNVMESELQGANAKIKNHSAQWDSLKTKLSEVSKKFDEAGKKLVDTGKNLTAKVTAPILAVGVGAAKMGMDFEESASKVSTIADTTTVSMDKLKGGVLGLSNETGQGASDLNEALYQTISAGVKTADSVEFLGTATKLAKGGFTDSTTAIDALTTTINAYGLKASDATTISDQLIQTQNLGKTTVAELGGEVGNVIPIAASMDVSTKDLLSSLAELTKNGVNTSEAVTGMKGALTNILSPTAEATKTAKQLGIDFSEAHLKNVGWPAFLDEVKEKTGGSSEKMASLFGNVRALNAVTILTGKGSQDFKTILGQMGDTAGTTDAAFAKMENNGAAKWEKAVNKMKNAGIKLGESLAPVVTKISDAVAKIADKFSKLTPAQQQMIIKLAAVVAAVGPVILVLGKLTTGVGTVMNGFKRFSDTMSAGKGIASALTAMVTPAGLAVAAIAALAAIAFVVIKNWGPISAFFKNLWNEIVEVTKPVWQAIQQVITSAWNVVGPTIINGVKEVQAFWNSVWPQIKQIFTDVWNAMKVFLQPIISFINMYIKTSLAVLQTVWKVAWTGIKDNFKLVWDLIVGVLKTAWGIISGVIKTQLDLVSGVFRIFKDLFSGNWSALWNDVKSLFSNIWNDISGIFTNMTKNVGDTFKNLAKDALQWGKDMIDGFVNGIKAKIEAVKDAVSNVAKEVRKKLHFSTPDEGPLADYETWMPDFMSGLAKGISANKYKVENAIKGLSSDMSIGVKAQYQPAYAGRYYPQEPESSGTIYNLYQTINAPKATSPVENARHGRNLLRQAVLRSRK